jgi:hypothetical protein
METELMSAAVALNASPETVLRAMRGPIVTAQIAYPQVLHLEVRDSTGAIWRLATQDADFSPLDPAKLVGRSIDDAEIDEATGGLRCALSDGSSLDVHPTKDRHAPDASGRDEPPSWELIAPSGLVLEFGPGLRWQIAGERRASGATGAHTAPRG